MYHFNEIVSFLKNLRVKKLLRVSRIEHVSKNVRVFKKMRVTITDEFLKSYGFRKMYEL